MTTARLLLVLLYPLLLVAGLVDRLRGRDPLRLKEPPDLSCWVECPPPPPARTYFSAASAPGGASGAWLAGVFARAARLFARSRGDGRGTPRPSVMPADVPDEVYTLW